MGMALAVLFALPTPSFAGPVDKLTVAAIDDVVAGDEGWIIAIDDVAADAGGWITAIDDVFNNGGIAAYAAETANGFETFGNINEYDDGIASFGRIVVETNIHSECIGKCRDYERPGQSITIARTANYTADKFGAGLNDGKNEIRINEKKQGHLKIHGDVRKDASWEVKSLKSNHIVEGRVVIEVEGEHSENNFWGGNDEYVLQYEKETNKGQWKWVDNPFPNLPHASPMWSKFPEYTIKAEATPIWADIHFHQYMTMEKDLHIQFSGDDFYDTFDYFDTDFYVDIFALPGEICRLFCKDGTHQYISYDGGKESQQRMKDFLTNHESLFSGVKTIPAGKLSFELKEELKDIPNGQKVIVIITPQYIKGDDGEWTAEEYEKYVSLDVDRAGESKEWIKDRQREYKKAVADWEHANQPVDDPLSTRPRPASFSSLYDNHIHFGISSYPLEFIGGDLIVGANIMDGFQSKFLGEVSSVGSSLFYQYDFAYAELSWDRLDFKGVEDGDLVKASIGLSYDYGMFHGGLSLSKYMDGKTSVNMRGISIVSEQDDEIRANLGMRIDF